MVACDGGGGCWPPLGIVSLQRLIDLAGWGVRLEEGRQMLGQTGCAADCQAHPGCAGRMRRVRSVADERGAGSPEAVRKVACQTVDVSVGLAKAERGKTWKSTNHVVVQGRVGPLQEVAPRPES